MNKRENGSASGKLKMVRCTLVAVSEEVPYVLASRGPRAEQYALNKKVCGNLWGTLKVGQQVDIHLIPDPPRPSKIVAVYSTSVA